MSIEKTKRLKAARRQDVMQAAVRVFFSRGVQAATMEEIAREAGVSKGALYLYFASKEDLYLSIAIAWLGELQIKLDQLAEQTHENALELARAAAKVYARHALSSPGHFQVMMSWLNTAYKIDESTPLFLDYRQAIARKYEFMAKAVESAKRDGSLLSEEPAARIVVQMWGAVLGLLLVEQNSLEMARRLPVSPPTDGICEAFIDNFITYLAAQEPTKVRSRAPLKTGLKS
jgi:AcrR family transcriptional regulator